MPLPASPASGGRNLPAIHFPIYTVAQEGLVGQLSNAFSIGGIEKGVLGAASHPYTYWIVQNNPQTILHLESQNLPFFVTQRQATAYANGLNAKGGQPKASAGNISYEDLNSIIGSTAAVTNQSPSTETGRAIDVNGFLSLLTSANLWLRVGEFVLGVMLILAGALHITGQSADLGAIAKTAVKVIK